MTATPSVEVTSADIARIAGVGPNAVSNWRKRHADFPAPVGGTDRSPRFDLAEIQTWLREQGKAVVVSADQELWQAFESVRAAMTPADALGMVGMLLLYLREHPQDRLPEDSIGMRRLLSEAEHFLASTETAVPDLLDLPRFGEIGARQATLLDAAARTAVDAGPNGAAETFDFLCERVLAGGARSGFASTSPELAELMVDLAGGAGKTLLDPACGTGSILLAAAARGYQRVEGQEVDAAIARIALLRLAFQAPDAKAKRCGIHVGDSFTADGYRGFEAGAVVSNPPFADRSWWTDSLLHDERWTYGTPARLESELAWVQHALAHLRPHGPAVLLMPPGAAFRGSGRRIREALVERGALRAVIALPPRLAASYSLSLQIWVLTRPDAGDAPPSRILMVDTADNEVGTTPSSGMRREAPTWDGVGDEIRAAWSAFAQDPERFVEQPGRARAVPIAQILGGDVDLTPRRHLPPPVRPEVAPRRLEDTRDTLAERMKALLSLLPDIPDLRAAHLEPVRVVSVDELAKADAILLRRPIPVMTEQEPAANAAAAVDVRAVTARDLVLGQPPTETMRIVEDALHNPPIRQGDVLVPAFGRRLVARVATSEDIGAHPSSGVFVLNCTNPEVVDPWYIAGYLSSSEGGRQATRAAVGSGDTARYDPRKVRIPLLPIEIQRSYGAAFRRLSEFGLALREVHNLGWNLAGRITDALSAELSEAARPIREERAASGR